MFDENSLNINILREEMYISEGYIFIYRVNMRAMFYIYLKF